MSNLMEVIKSRRSTRAFKSELPPKDQIMQIVEAAEWAPSGMGKYLWHFTVIYNAEKSLKLARAVAEADNRGPEYNFYGAPVNIIISYKRDEHHALVDGAAAMENLLLMATELGLGSCWINQLRETCDVPEVRALLTEYGVPEDHIVVCSAAIGYIEKETPAKPNAAHLKLAEWEREGKCRAVVTQNIDGLHQKAGSKEVLELHGSVLRNYCMRCRKPYPVEDIAKGTGIPRCSCGGIIKPDVVLYEEGLDSYTINKSVDYISKADILIIGGTSLAVYPAASLIDYYRGNKLVLVNKSPTPADRRADLVIHAPIGEVFSQL